MLYTYNVIVVHDCIILCKLYLVSYDVCYSLLFILYLNLLYSILYVVAENLNANSFCIENCLHILLCVLK